MIIACAFCFLIGATLGSRFKVAILMPAMLLIAFAMLSFGVLTDQSVSFMFVSQICALVATQLGFLSSLFFATVTKTHLSSDSRPQSAGLIK